MSLWSHVDDDGDRLVLREFTDGNMGLAIHSRGGHVSLVYLKRAALLDLHDAIGNALLTKEDKQTLSECTHGADCRVHPDAKQVHNFDPGYAR